MLEMAVGDLIAWAAEKTMKFSEKPLFLLQRKALLGRLCWQSSCSKVLVTAKKDAWPQLLLWQVRTGRGVLKSQLLTSCKKILAIVFRMNVFSLLPCNHRMGFATETAEASFPLLNQTEQADSKGRVEGKESSFDPICARQHSWAGTGVV